jgi:Flp pilus assembly pilin Flp
MMTKRLRNERGAAVVEMALVFPLVFLVLMCSLSLLWLLAARSTLTGAARDGARFASIRHDPLECPAAPCDTDWPSTAEVTAFVVDRVGGFGVDEVTVERPSQPNEIVSVTVKRDLPVLVDAVASIFGTDELVYTSTAKVRAE